MCKFVPLSHLVRSSALDSTHEARLGVYNFSSKICGGCMVTLGPRVILRMYGHPNGVFRV